MDIVRANNAVVSVVEFYAGAVGSLTQQVQAKDALIEQLGNQLKAQGKELTDLRAKVVDYEKDIATQAAELKDLNQLLAESSPR